MKIKISTLLCLTVVVILAVYSIWLYESAGFHTVRSLQEEDGYLIHNEEMIPVEYVADLVVGEGKLFVHYENSELVNVYSTSGEFLYGIQIEDGSNGFAGICLQDGLLYFAGKSTGIYIFRGVEFVEMIPSTSGNLEIFDNNAKLETDGFTYHYVKEDNKIIRANSSVTEDLLVFPRKDFEEILCFAGCVLCLYCAVFMERGESRKNIEKSKNNA